MNYLRFLQIITIAITFFCCNYCKIEQMERQLLANEDRKLVNNRLVQVNLTNYMNRNYVGKIHLGDDQQFQVAFDITSNHVWLSQSLFQICFSNSKYSCSLDKCSQSLREIPFEHYSVIGNDAHELFRIGTVTTSFPFLAALTCENQTSTFKGDGVFGLGSNKEENIVNKLYEENKIDENVFALKLSSIDLKENLTDNISQLTIGGYDKSLVNENDIKYFENVFSQQWGIKLQAVKFGSAHLFVSGRYAMIDITKPYIYIPRIDYPYVKYIISKEFENKCWTNDEQYLCECDAGSISSKSLLSFTLRDIHGQEQTISLQPEYYIKEVNGGCLILVEEIQDQSSKTWVLGLSFMRHTYNIFNLDRKVIGIVNLNLQTDSSSNSDSTPNSDSSSSSVLTSISSSFSSLISFFKSCGEKIYVYFLVVFLLTIVAVMSYNRYRRPSKGFFKLNSQKSQVNKKDQLNELTSEINQLHENIIPQQNNDQF